MFLISIDSPENSYGLMSTMLNRCRFESLVSSRQFLFYPWSFFGSLRHQIKAASDHLERNIAFHLALGHKYGQSFCPVLIPVYV